MSIFSRERRISKQLRADIEKMRESSTHKSKIKKILNELTDVVNKYGQDRKTRIIFASEVAEEETEGGNSRFSCQSFLLKGGLSSRITPQAIE